MVKERGILFSSPMVLALLDGTKTQTRRIVKPAPPEGWHPDPVGDYYPTKVDRHGEEYPGPKVYGAADESWGLKCPYGRPGDVLWVRETWGIDPNDMGYDMTTRKNFVHYRAEGTTTEPFHWGWIPSIHMFRWASRIDLRITEVRVQRLQDISEEDAIAEGIVGLSKDGNLYKYGVGEPSEEWRWQDWKYTAVEAYRYLWEKINGAGSWDLNPFVWAVSFEKVGAEAKEEGG